MNSENQHDNNQTSKPEDNNPEKGSGHPTDKSDTSNGSQWIVGSSHKEKPNEHASSQSSAIVIVQQWLSYSFWFWTLGVLCAVLSGVIITSFIETNQDNKWIIYTAAPLIVLLPLAAVTDHFYKKVEPKHKKGFAAVVMVVNAVIAALCAVGAAVAIVYALLDLVLSTDADTTGNTIAFVVAIIIALLSALFFARVIYHERLKTIREKFTHIVTAITAFTLLLVIVFPLVNEVRKKSDRIVENNYGAVTRAIRDYADENKQLPQSLSDVDFEKGAKAALDTGKLTYSPKSSSLGSFGSSNRSREFNYEMCVDWDHELEGSSSYSRNRSSFYKYDGHEKGKQCYDEKAIIYNYNY